jgi:hypothetical protein
MLHKTGALCLLLILTQAFNSCSKLSSTGTPGDGPRGENSPSNEPPLLISIDPVIEDSTPDPFPMDPNAQIIEHRQCTITRYKAALTPEISAVGQAELLILESGEFEGLLTFTADTKARRIHAILPLVSNGFPNETVAKSYVNRKLIERLFMKDDTALHQGFNGHYEKIDVEKVSFVNCFEI